MNRERLQNYDNLIARIDQFCQRIENELKECITCHPGCSSCCLSITVFPVEQLAIKRWVESLPKSALSTIKEHLESSHQSEKCSLLFDDRCLVYPVRPIICRTHGLPVIYQQGADLKTDCCPLNHIDIKEIDSSLRINLDTLNTMLVAINKLFCQETGIDDAGQRIAIVDVVKKTCNQLLDN